MRRHLDSLLPAGVVLAAASAGGGSDDCPSLATQWGEASAATRAPYYADALEAALDEAPEDVAASGDDVVAVMSTGQRAAALAALSEDDRAALSLALGQVADVSTYAQAATLAATPLATTAAVRLKTSDGPVIQWRGDDAGGLVMTSKQLDLAAAYDAAIPIGTDASDPVRLLDGDGTPVAWVDGVGLRVTANSTTGTVTVSLSIVGLLRDIMSALTTLLRVATSPLTEADDQIIGAGIYSATGAAQIGMCLARKGGAWYRHLLAGTPTSPSSSGTVSGTYAAGALTGRDHRLWFARGRNSATGTPRAGYAGSVYAADDAIGGQASLAALDALLAQTDLRLILTVVPLTGALTVDFKNIDTLGRSLTA